MSVPDPARTVFRSGTRLANPWPFDPDNSRSSVPVSHIGVTIDPSRLPSGSVVATPPEGHWIVKGVPPDVIKEAETGRDVFPT